MISFIRRFSIFDYYPATLALFLLGWVINQKTGFSLAMALPGLLLLAYLPGYYLIRLAQLPITQWHWYGRLALYFATSIVIIALAQFVTKTSIAFTALSQTALLLLINTGLYLLVKLFAIPGNVLPNAWQRVTALLRRSSRIDYLVLLIPLVLYGITLLINPTVDNADNYLQLFQETVDKQEYPFGYPRSVFFIPFLAIYHYVTQLSPVTIFKLILTLSFYSSLFVAFDYLKRNIKDRYLVWLSYLTILAPPVILVEANIVRPQLLVMAFTLPILILLIEAIKSSNYRLLGLAFLFAVGVTGFHELGAVLVLMALASLAAMLVSGLFIRKDLTITLKQVAIAAIIIAPYFKIVNPLSFTEPITRMVKYAAGFFNQINWQWWFIDSYTTIDGFNIGWPGIQALHYYLYNGLLFMGAVILLSLGIFWHTRQSRQKKQRTWIILLPLLYVFFYFTFAELLPRIGLFFLPNRAWPHLMLGLIVCLILLIEHNQKFLAQYLKPITALFILAILPGILGTLYLTYNRVGTVFPEEIAAARFIYRELPKDSAFISTQPNYDLVRFYANRDYIQANDLYPKPITDVLAFEEANRKYLASLTSAPEPFIQPEQYVLTQRFSGANVIEQSKVVIAPEQRVVPQSRIKPGQPVYFIYSLRKVRGLNAAREYNKGMIDAGSEAFFTSLPPNEYVYRDNAVIIIRAD